MDDITIAILTAIVIVAGAALRVASVVLQVALPFGIIAFDAWTVANVAECGWGFALFVCGPLSWLGAYVTVANLMDLKAWLAGVREQ